MFLSIIPRSPSRRVPVRKTRIVFDSFACETMDHENTIPNAHANQTRKCKTSQPEHIRMSSKNEDRAQYGCESTSGQNQSWCNDSQESEKNNGLELSGSDVMDPNRVS